VESQWTIVERLWIEALSVSELILIARRDSITVRGSGRGGGRLKRDFVKAIHEAYSSRGGGGKVRSGGKPRKRVRIAEKEESSVSEESSEEGSSSSEGSDDDDSESLRPGWFW